MDIFYKILGPGRSQNSRRGLDGFTIIEASVVLLIIALIIGGIVIGQDVIRNSEMQSIITDVDRFKNAAKQFKEKYNYLPGDLPTATTYWGTDTEGALGCPDGGPTPKIETCNGNGDGKVRDLSGGNLYTNPMLIGDNNYESLRVWQHLADAGFIEGSYNGAAVSSNYKPGTNIPMSKANETAGFIFFYSDPIDASQNDPTPTAYLGVYPNNYGHIIEYGGGVTSKDILQTFRGAPGLTGVQAMNLDQKIDDGIPNTGNVLSYTSTVQNCSIGSPPVYDISTTDIVCSLIFVTGL